MRKIGYEPPDDALEFLEFYWADRGDVASYLATIKTASAAMTGLKATDIVSGGKTAQALGWTGAFSRAALDEQVTPMGKLSYAIAHKKALAR
ncbi:hypothetical protein CSZ94_26535 [Janthinobacterium sp. ROICE36]|uniref:hypothetical protein n=1 Tax=Janthinobacterium sp. ROICE36 TaxID=2048670 RepID=UPI000C7F3D10|nr:hypothetical protein [Janthinobacterium sp. ROICE36]PLY39412.1 hypothetical protein CSZ94_26535 [Janthinobacterium sp. ROICE36]